MDEESRGEDLLGRVNQRKIIWTLAEHPFGTIKRWFGYPHFLLKGLVPRCGMRCEWQPNDTGV